MRQQATQRSIHRERTPSRRPAADERRIWANLLIVLCAAPASCALGLDSDKIPANLDIGTRDAAASDAPTDSVVSAPTVSVTSYGTYRAWSDGTYATSCNAYVHPPSPTHVYEGAIGSGVYAVKPALAQSPIRVLCDMTANAEGWTLLTTSSAEGRAEEEGTRTKQTSECVTLTSDCNVAGQAWDYDTLRETWSDCPGGEARIAKAAFQDDTNACTNQLDGLQLTWDRDALPGMKSWNCAHECAGPSWFAGQGFRLPTLVSDGKFVTSPELLRAVATGGGECAAGTVVSYGCGSGYDNIWLR